MNDEYDQHKVGMPMKRRGQQTGFAGNPDQNRVEKAETPELSGRRDDENEMFADASAQQTGSDSVTPNSASPSVAAFSGGGHVGESGDEIAFKQQQEKQKETK